MRLSTFGERLTRGAGILSLMEDLGTALAGRTDMLMLGGGNPGHIPAVQSLFRDRMRRILETPGEFEGLIGNYDAPQGEARFIEALADLFHREYGWKISPKNIALTSGSQLGFFILFNLFAGAFGNGTHRKVLLPMAPEYIGYADLGLSPDFFITLRPTIDVLDEHTFKYRVDFGRLAMTDEVGAICVSRPTNPTGNVLTDEEIHHLVGSAQRAEIPLIIDNAYGIPFPNIIFTEASPLWNESVILCMSLSKLGLPGTRTGIIVAKQAVVEAIASVNAILSLASGSFGPALALDLVKTGEIIRVSRDLIKPYYEARAHQAVAWLNEELQGCNYLIHKPEGALFLWLWFPDLPITSAELYARLKQRGVLVVSGHYFFPGLKDDWRHQQECIRITYSQDPQVVRQGLKIIAEEVKKAYAVSG
jgi:valine--pyruvate aminotransferase